MTSWSTSIKAKWSVVIIVAVVVTGLSTVVAVRAGVPSLLAPALSGLVALAIVQVMAKGMTSPLRQMAVASERMAAGDYDQTVSVTTRDEVGRLAESFNRMAADLGAVDTQRRDLVANVSHELRTPLAALQAQLENVIDGVTDPDTATFEAMHLQTARLTRLVAQLLDLSRLEAGAFGLVEGSVDVRTLCEGIVAEAALSGEADRLDIEPIGPEGQAVFIVGDGERLHQVLANLVENALRFSPPDGSVTVACSVDGDVVQLSVSDHGPGIPADERDRVFERFHRSDDARATRDGGSGLGLAIVRWIVELHDGSIHVEPNVPTGTRMVVRLPRSADGAEHTMPRWTPPGVADVS